VTEAIERFSFNVALARLMEFADQARSARARSTLVRLLAPFAPHLAEELWSRLGEPFSVHTQSWPSVDGSERSTSNVDLVVQVDGKRRGVISVPPDADENEVDVAARRIVTAVPDPPGRVVYVPGRVINYVSK
jgi:leucyl-tRNA synthetase